MNQKVGFSILQFLSYIAFGLCMSNFIPIMEHYGYDSFQRGFALSGYAVVTIVLQIAFGYLSDRFHIVKKTVVFSMLIFGILSAWLYSGFRTDLVFFVIIVALVGGFINSIGGLLDTWIMGISFSMQESLSQIKAFGSIGWALGSLGTSVILLHFHFFGISVILLILSFLFMVFSIPLQEVQTEIVKEKISLKDVAKIFQIKEYRNLISALTLMYSLAVLNSGLVVDKMLSLNAGTMEISWKWAMGSFLEIPMYLLCMRFIRKYGAIQVLRVSAFIATIQFLLFGLAGNAVQIIMICSLQAFTTPIIMIASKMRISEIVPKQLRASGQMVAMSLFMGISSLVIPIFSGFIGIRWGYNVSLFFFAGFGALALWILFKTDKKIEEA